MSLARNGGDNSKTAFHWSKMLSGLSSYKITLAMIRTMEKDKNHYICLESTIYKIVLRIIFINVSEIILSTLLLVLAISA